MPYESKKRNSFRALFTIDINARLGLVSEVNRTFQVFFLPLNYYTFWLLYDPLIPQKTLLSC